MDRHVLPTFSGRILAIDTAVAQRCAALHVPNVQNPRSDRDALIAATALVHGLTVATRNVAHFERAGVGVLNPWEA
jgi:toxin FitB